MKMTYGQISHFDFSKAMNKLTQAGLPIKASYEVKKLADKIMEARREIAKEYEAVIEGWVKKNEDGTVARPEGQPNGWDVLDEHKEKFLAFNQSFGEKEVIIPREKIAMSVLGNMTITASELAVLEPVLDYGDDERPAASVTPIHAS